MEKLSYLVYSSVRNANCTDEEIQKILNSCERNNPSKSVTGVLIHSQNYFLQFLEGEENEIMDLLNHIKKDSRHSKVILLNKGEIEARMFPAWHMGFKDADKDGLTLISDASSSEEETFNNLLKGEVIEDTKVLKMLRRFYKTV